MALEVNADNLNALRALLRRIPAGEREGLFGTGNGGSSGASSGSGSSAKSGGRSGGSDSSVDAGEKEPSLFMVVWPNADQGSGTLHSDGQSEIEGEAPDEHLTGSLQESFTKHHGIALENWEWGVDSPATGNEGGNWSAGAPVPRELQVTFKFDAATPKLLKETFEGRAIAALSILSVRSVPAAEGGDEDGKSDYYLLVKIYDAWINSISLNGSKEGKPSVTMSLSFWNIEFRYRKSKKGGGLDYSDDHYYQWYPQAGVAGTQAEDSVVNRFEKSTRA